MTTEFAISLIAIGLSILSFLYSRFEVQIKMEARLTSLETKMGVFWRVIEEKAVAILHAPIHYERDALLDKLLANKRLSPDDCDRLISMLDDIVEQRESTTPDERMAALLLLARLKSQKATRKGH
jgi:hypothetical protein